jgi:hypothetical protein
MSPHYFVETHQPSTRLIGVGIFDNDLRFVAVNSVLAKMNGVPLEKHLGRRLRDVLGAGAIRIEHAVESVLSSQKSLLRIEVRAELPGRKEVCHFIETICPVKGMHGTIKEVAALAVEITEHRIFAGSFLSDGVIEPPRQAAEFLRRSENKLREQGLSLARVRVDYGTEWPAQ